MALILRIRHTYNQYLYACTYINREWCKVWRPRSGKLSLFKRICMHQNKRQKRNCWTKYTWVCMYACMYVRECVCMHACMYVSVYVCMHVCTWVCMYACMYVREFVCMHACMYVSMYVCMHVCTWVCMYALHACMHTYIHSTIHILTWVCMYVICFLTQSTKNICTCTYTCTMHV